MNAGFDFNNVSHREEPAEQEGRRRSGSEDSGGQQDLRNPAIYNTSRPEGLNASTREPPSAGLLGTGGSWILDSIVNLLAALRVNPNILTLIGLFINIFAAVLFAKGMFTWAGLVVLFAGIFDMVDGEVARRTGRVTRFGAFFDSVIDRYSDMVLLLGLVDLVREARSDPLRRPCGDFADRIDHDQLHARPRRIAHSCLQSRVSRKAGTDCPADHRCADQPDGRRDVGHGDSLQLDRLSAHLVHVAGNQEAGTDLRELEDSGTQATAWSKAVNPQGACNFRSALKLAAIGSPPQQDEVVAVTIRKVAKPHRSSDGVVWSGIS